MNFVKKLFSFLLIIIFLSGAGLLLLKKNNPNSRNYFAITKPCRAPIHYALGEIDPRFKITPEQLQVAIADASQTWTQAVGNSVFVYDVNANFKIQFVYDDRQAQSDEAAKLQDSLRTLDAQQTTMTQKQSSLTEQYKQKLVTFKQDMADYESQLQKYNAAVIAQNAQGGATPEVYDQLKKEQSDLKKQADKLKAEQAALNSLAGKANAIVKQENSAIGQYNSAVITFKNKYGGAQEFEKGVFDPNGITIYQFREMNDLRLTLIHELGHALGLGHVENSRSIMYYLMGEQDLDHPTLTTEDKAELTKVCQL